MKLFHILIIGILWNVCCSLGDSAVDETLRKLDEHSAKIDDATREIYTLTKNAMDTYYKLTQSNYEWCGVAINRFQSYLDLLQNSTKDEAMKQHRIMVQVLEKGAKEMSSAQQRREETKQTFSEAAQKNYARISQLNVELNNEIDSDASAQVDRLLLDAAKSRRCILMVCWDTKLTRQIKSLIQKIGKKQAKVHKEMDVAFINSNTKAITTQKILHNEFYPISKIVSQTESSRFIISLVIKMGSHDPTTKNLIKDPIEKLIEICREYRSEHKP